MSIEETAEVGVVSQESKNFALLTWIGTLFFGFIPGLIVYLVKTDDAYRIKGCLLLGGRFDAFAPRAPM